MKFLHPLCLSAHKAAGLILKLTFLRLIFWLPSRMRFPLRELAMELLFLQIFALTVEVNFNLTTGENQVAPALEVAPFDCGEMTGNTFHAINQVRPCHITPEELETSKAKVVLYTKHFRKESNATKWRAQNQRQNWHCGHHDHSSIDHTSAGTTSDIVISPEQCRTLAKGKDITLLGQSKNFGFDTKNPIVKILATPAMTRGMNVMVEVGSLVTPSSFTCRQQL